ncbi:bifunctional non-homologous end joining protein LigD [Pedobacter westerhofensis]|uniref:DNA ligase (ATP) n=1 Tax=Pedobacter westerhofensis TaxID=425512 RepID=A0A521CW05_9SPHI|nr:DNA ligase D [Pedobacter westerhofensis]SMO62921.1 bifunctional non-homologous end joining protein LigD [Pedobacter westerhofensis]
MSLSKYVAKRDFTKTAEPKAGKSKDKNKLLFVIQKHDASRLHYDFRLEMDGVLKSWAVPKGPSTDPKTKRLAMMVEDHPFDYRNFEGTIPKGEYGGGTVIVWDEGTYEPIEEIKGKKAQEKHLLKQLESGSVKIKLHGHKLEGEFALVKTHGMGDNAWLLIKHNDDFASAKDITKKDESVLSGKTIEAVEQTSDAVWKDGHKQHIKSKPAGKGSTKTAAEGSKKTAAEGNTKTAAEESAKTAAEGKAKTAVKGKAKKSKSSKDNKQDDAEPDPSEPVDSAAVLKKIKKSSIPTGMKPMLATLVSEPFDDPGWTYEVKWDGYRALGFVNKGDVELLSRNNKSFNEKFYPIYDLLKKWKINAVLDGEILVLNDKGVSNFGSLQNWRSEADGDLVYYVFDLLWYDGKSLMELPLYQRQAILQDILPVDDDRIRLSKIFKASGTGFFAAAQKMGLEGIIAKKSDSLYLSDYRSKEWLKVKVHKRQEVVIAGFTKNQDTSKQFSSLLLGVYEDGALQYVGKVGTGFSDQVQREMIAQFKPLITDKSPFDSLPDINKPSRFRPNPPKAKATWLKPRLVCEVAYAEITTDGVFRHPSFQGMRIDKSAKEVVRETAAPTVEVIAEVEAGLQDTVKNDNHPNDMVKPAKDKGKRTLLNPKDETQVRKLKGHELKFTHLSKIYWPEDKVSKRDLFNYYYQIAEYMIPYIKDRPMSLNRFPNGINGPSFYQKDVKGKAPDWVKTFPYTNGEGEHKEYLVGTDEASLLWMASLGCIEMNPWFSRVQSEDNPDYCVIDLDPDKNTFDQVIQAALEVKKVLDALDVPCCCKTSGSTGIHIYIPMGAKYSYEQSQLFARLIVNLVHEQLPDFTTLERTIADRHGKMYLDFLQNRPGATIAGPYSLRPKPGATVSMPLHWDEVKPGLKMSDFTIFNAVERVRAEGDLFKGVLGKGIDLEKTITKSKTIFG